MIVFLALACAAAGIAFSFWPLIPLGVALMVLYGHTALGVTLGLFFDVIYGPPQGLFLALHFPFLLFALLCLIFRILAVSYILERSDPGAI